MGPQVGSASAVKMSTASVYKGTTALVAQALCAAHANGVLDHVVADLRTAAPDLVASAERRISVAATKAHRYVGEMGEIAATQAATRLTPALFAAIREVYGQVADTPLARASPEDVPSLRSSSTASTGCCSYEPPAPGIQSVPASGTFAIAAASTVSATRSSGSRFRTCDFPQARASVCVSSVSTRR